MNEPVCDPVLLQGVNNGHLGRTNINTPYPNQIKDMPRARSGNTWKWLCDRVADWGDLASQSHSCQIISLLSWQRRSHDTGDKITTPSRMVQVWGQKEPIAQKHSRDSLPQHLPSQSPQAGKVSETQLSSSLRRWLQRVRLRAHITTPVDPENQALCIRVLISLLKEVHFQSQ